MFYTRSARWLFCFLLAICTTAGCFSTPPAQTDVLVFGRGGDANTLDPIHTDIGESVKVMINIYDTLVTYDDKTTDLVPGVAKAWSHSEDGLTWTFQLRDDVLFHDGTKLDADAVVFSFERLLKDKHPGLFHVPRPYQSAFRAVQSVTAKDPATVVFRLDKPNAVFLQNLAMFPASIVSPTAVKKHGKAFGDHPVGSGPFKFASWQRDQTIKLTAFDDHFRGPPGTKGVIFLRVSDNSTRAQQLRRGESHIADDLSPDELDALASVPGMFVQEQPGLNVFYLSMQMEKDSPLKHLDVRRAIAHAIDKQKLIEIVYGGHANPAVNMCPQLMPGHNNDIVDREFDTAKAKQLLAACAQQEGFSLPLKLTLATLTDPRPYLPQPKLAASFIKDSLAEIGIRIETQPRDVNQHFTYVMAGKHDLALAGWQTDNNDLDNFLFQLLHSDNISEHGNNLSRYRNPEVDRLLSAGQTELDREKRLKLYEQAQALIFADAPTVPLAHGRLRVAQSDKVHGYILHPTGLVRLRLAHFGDSP
jgi:peptide/nickel transport system substrate-binding protein